MQPGARPAALLLTADRRPGPGTSCPVHLNALHSAHRREDFLLPQTEEPFHGCELTREGLWTQDSRESGAKFLAEALPTGCPWRGAWPPRSCAQRGRAQDALVLLCAHGASPGPPGAEVLGDPEFQCPKGRRGLHGAHHGTPDGSGQTWDHTHSNSTASEKQGCKNSPVSAGCAPTSSAGSGFAVGGAVWVSDAQAGDDRVLA